MHNTRLCRPITIFIGEFILSSATWANLPDHFFFFLSSTQEFGDTDFEVLLEGLKSMCLLSVHNQPNRVLSRLSV